MKKESKIVLKKTLEKRFEESGKTKAELARHLGVGKSYISKLLKKEDFSTLNIKTVIMMSEFFGIEIGELLEIK